MTFLLDCSIKVAVIVALGLVATWLLRRQSAALRHGILTTAIVCATVTPVATMLLPAWNISSWFERPVAPPIAQVAVETTVSSNVDATPVAPLPVRQFPAVPVWLTGTAVALMTLLVGLIRLMRVAAFSRELTDDGWRTTADTVGRRYGLRRSVRLLQSPNASILVTWGVLRPQVIVPAGAEKWQRDRVHVVLSHELAHVRRYDWLIQMTAEILRAIYWFNPLLWIACNRLRQDSEYACDDAAIAEGIDGTEYAAHLLDLARALNTPDRAWSAALAMARPSTVERRFKAMLNPALNRRPVTRFAMVVLAIAALCITLPLSALQSAAQPVQTAGRNSTVTVTDANGAAVSGAAVIVSTPNGVSEATLTTSGASATFAGLAAGTHVLQVFANGFGASRLTTVELKGDQDLKQDIKMDIGFVKNPVLPTATTAKVVPNTVNVSEGQAAGLSFVGVVKDPAGLVVPGVEVMASSADLKRNALSKTDDHGQFHIASMPDGIYRVTFAMPGFKTLNVDNNNVAGGKTLTVNANLQVSPVAEAMTITPTSNTGAQSYDANDKPFPVAQEWTSPTGGVVQFARLQEVTRPAYPQEALAAGVQGAVVLQGVIGKDGKVLALKVVSGPPMLQQAAVDAASTFRYTPSLLDGSPIELVSVFTINFNLGQ